VLVGALRRGERIVSGRAAASQAHNPYTQSHIARLVARPGCMCMRSCVLVGALRRGERIVAGRAAASQAHNLYTRSHTATCTVRAGFRLCGAQS